MLQNIKVDLVYHNTPSDFEMEFNLCGCCRMRLLSEKTTDKKGLVSALAKAVARSRIIIASGPLFGEEGLISIVATAIGKALCGFDNAAYGINIDDEISIIKGSTPLVTPDGYFGGCIIESGPQTIILLTENRAFRKTIMKNLIHPYIEQVSVMPIKQSHPVKPPQPVAPPMALAEGDITAGYITEPEQDTATQELPPEQISETDADMITEVSLDEEEPQEPEEITAAPEDEHNIAFVMDEEEAEPEQELTTVQSEMYVESEADPQIAVPYEHSFIPSEEDRLFLTEQEKEEKAPKSGSKAINIPIIILSVLLIAAVLVLCYFILIKPMTMGVSTSEYMREIFGAASSAPII